MKASCSGVCVGNDVVPGMVMLVVVVVVVVLERYWWI
jgi:hypothetical protein